MTLLLMTTTKYMEVGMTDYDFEMAWASIYWTFQDNAFDMSRVFYLKDSIIVDGKEWVEVPF
jgi:hypothetical protein